MVDFQVFLMLYDSNWWIQLKFIVFDICISFRDTTKES